MIDMMKALFRSGVPYDAETNTFRVGPEHMSLIEQQRAQIAEEESWPLRTSHFLNPGRGWDDFDL